MLEVTVNQRVGTINWNYEELKGNLAESLKKYNQVVTAETIKNAKEDMALLNKVDKAIADKVKDVKEQYCSPYLTFAEQAKELREMVKNARTQIDVQVKAFDEQEKAEKKEKIVEYFNATGFKLVCLERLFDDRWLNKTCTEKKWQEELNKKIETINKDMNMISMFGSMSEDERKTIQAYYLKILDLARAKAQYDEMQALKQSIKEETPVAPVIEQVEHSQEIAYEREQSFQEQMQPKEELYTRTFTVFDCTREQIVALGNYMNANGIKFRKA